MPTSVWYGKKGSGKSYGVLKEWVWRELIHGERQINCTLCLRLDKLQALAEKRYPEKRIDVNKRIRMLTREEGRRFWLHREHGVNIEEIEDEDYDNGLNPDYQGAIDRVQSKGILNIIDEAYVDFDAQRWVKIGRGLTYYMGQERKFLDDSVFMTPHLKWLAGRVKDGAQEWVECRNYAYEKFLTFLSKGSRMRTRVYSEAPRGNMTDRPDSTHSYKIDPELAECYDTTGGLGFKGLGKPDTKRKKWAPPWWVIFGAVPVGAYAFNLVTDQAGGMLAGSKKGQTILAGAGVIKKSPAAPSGAAGVDSATAAVPFTLAADAPVKTPFLGRATGNPANEVKKVVGEPVTGIGGRRYASNVTVTSVAEDRKRDRVIVQLSDGSVLTEEDGVRVFKNRVEVDDGRSFIRKAPESRPVPVASKASASPAGAPTGAANPATTAVAPLTDYEKYGERGGPISPHHLQMGWSPPGGGKP